MQVENIKLQLIKALKLHTRIKSDKIEDYENKKEYDQPLVSVNSERIEFDYLAVPKLNEFIIDETVFSESLFNEFVKNHNNFDVYQNEFEIRFTKYLNSALMFESVKRYFDNMLNVTKKSVNRTFSDYVHETSSKSTFANIRKVINPVTREFHYEKKVEIKKLDFGDKSSDWGFKISISSENPYVSDELKDWEATYTRKIKRFSYIFNNKKSVWYGFRVDLSVVNTRALGNMSNSYEFEIEKVNDDEVINYNNLLKIINISYSIMNDGFYLASLSTRKQINILFDRLTLPNKNQTFNFMKPTILTLKELANPNWNPALTIKLDGKRCFLLFEKYFTAIVFPKTVNGGSYHTILIEVSQNGEEINKDFGTIFDGELCYDEDDDLFEFFAFDVLFFGDKDVRNQIFITRLNYITIFDHTERNKLNTDRFNFRKKTYFYTPDLYQNVHSTLNDAVNYKYHSDGLIFQYSGHYVISNSLKTYKWKPLSELTIDFYVKKVGNVLLPFFIDEKKIFMEFRYKGKQYPVIFSGDIDGFTTIHEMIVECAFDYSRECFNAMRIRYDKLSPNFKTVAFDTFRAIVDKKVTDKTVKGETGEVMRKFHNDMKFNLLKKYIDTPSESVLLDIGVGQGGDIQKWFELGVRRVYGVEPNKEMIAIFSKRLEDSVKGYKKMKNEDPVTEIKIIESTIQDTMKVVNQSKSIDYITSFFSIMTLGESEEVMDNAIKTLVQVIKKSGNKQQKFFGIVLDGETLMKYFEKSKMSNINSDHINIISTTTFDIIQTVESDRAFGKKIVVDIKEFSSFVRNIEEYIFPFEEFKRKMEENDFTLLATEMLSDNPIHKFLPVDSKIYNSLMRFFIFEKNVSEENKTKSYSLKLNVDFEDQESESESKSSDEDGSEDNSDDIFSEEDLGDGDD